MENSTDREYDAAGDDHLESSRSLQLFGIVLLAFSVAFPPLDDATALSLTAHMVQHVLIVASGVLLGYPLYSKAFFSKVKGKKTATYLGVILLLALVTFWHLSPFYDAAVLNPIVHATEHASFFAIGFLIGTVIQELSARNKIHLLLLGFFAQVAYGYVLLANYPIYPVYSLADQGILAIVMFATGPAYWTGVIYLILHHREWFAGEDSVSGAIPARKKRLRPFNHHHYHHRQLAMLIRIATVSLSVSMILFYGASAIAVSFAPSVPSQTQGPSSSVYIVETPLSWQYSPQNLRVEMEVNNTVTWISHSTSYDTVTGVNASFASNPIAPGQTFTHVFTQPGTFQYRCIYHPWMIGYVTVVGAPSSSPNLPQNEDGKT